MPAKARKRKATPAGLENSLRQLAGRLSKCSDVKDGLILVRATGAAKGNFYLECSGKSVRLGKPASPKVQPRLEIIGDERKLATILSGTVDVRKRFLAGGFRIRGDIRYASDLALKLGILKEPL